MKIAIYGAGAIGGYLGVLLKLAGADVSLVARGAHLEAIRKDGLKLRSTGRRNPPACPRPPTQPSSGRRTTSSSRSRRTRRGKWPSRWRRCSGPSTAVVTAQNGVPWWYFYGFEGQYANRRIESVDPGDRQWNAIGPQRVIGCTVYPAAEIEAPGVDQAHLRQQVRTRRADAGSDRARRPGSRKMFETAGLKAPVMPEIRNDIWLKLWGNLCFNPISALTRATLDVVATEPGTRTSRAT